MEAILGALGGAAVTLALVGLIALVRGRSRADLTAQLEAAHRESDDLRRRLDAMRPANHGETFVDAGEFVITDLGIDRPADDPGEQVDVPDRMVLSATFGAPLVKVAAFTHGLRRALSAESRNRIRFQMRQEVRAARKRRRQAYKQYQRDVRAAEREAV